MRTPYLVIALFLISVVGYAGLTRVTFSMPQTVAEGAVCDFTPGDFTPAGTLRYSENGAWWVSFVRKQDYFSAMSIGLAIAFAGFALLKVRQIGAGATSGSVAGGSLLVGLTLSFSCLAPVLAAIGVGFFANVGLALVAFPKWLVALNTMTMTTYGFLYVSRRATCRPTVRCTSTISAGAGATR